MKLFRLVICCLFLAASLSPCNALVRGGYGTGGAVVNMSSAGINVGDTNTNNGMFPFVNFIKSTPFGADDTGTTFVYPNFLAADTNLPTGTPTGIIGGLLTLPENYFGQFVLSIAGTVTPGTFQQGIGFTSGQTNSGAFGQVYAVSAGTVLSGCGSGIPPCQFANQLWFGGTNPQLTMDFSGKITGAVDNGSGTPKISTSAAVNLPNGAEVTVSGIVGSNGLGCGANGLATIANQTPTTVDLQGLTFTAGCTYTSGGQIFAYQATTNSNVPTLSFRGGTYSLTSMSMCKLADFNADNTCNTTAGQTSWAAGFNDDYVSALATLRPAHIRFLDYNNSVFGNPPDFAHWQSTNTFSYSNNSFWVIPNWFGSDSGTNSYSINCSNGQACTYTLTGGAPVDGDVVQFYNSNASTGMNPTLTLTDHAGTTSSAIPILDQEASQLIATVGGTITAGDTIKLNFTTSPLGAYTCLSGSSHSTPPYTVLVSDTPTSISTALNSIFNSDATLSAQPSFITSVGTSGVDFFIGYASNACTLSVTATITGSATETVSIGTMDMGAILANTHYTAVYNAFLKSWILNTQQVGGARQAWPWIVQIDLAKAVSTKAGISVGCWLQPNLIWSTASFTSLATLANANQCPGGTKFEFSNEVAWNFGNVETAQSRNIAASLGLGPAGLSFYEMRQRQWWQIASSAFGGLTGNLFTQGEFQEALLSNPTSALIGTGLCGTSCSNQAYQAAVGTDYNAFPNRPVDFTRTIGQAPYYNGSVLNAFYGFTYGTWSATSSSVASNVLNVSGAVTGTIFWNQGISSCDGVYIAASNPSNPYGAQLTGTVTTTLNGAVNNFNSTWTLTSVTGLQTGMWVYDITTGLLNGTIGSINSGASQITITNTPNNNTYASAGSNDSLVFGGKAGTYQLNSTTCSAGSGTITGGDILGLQYAADNYNAINGAIGNQQDALNWVFQDAFNSALDGSLSTVTTVRSLKPSYIILASVANAFSKTVEDYEGAFQSRAPSTSEATGIGLSSTYGGSTGFINTLLSGFKSNILFKNLEVTRHNEELAILPAGSMSQYYVVSTNPQWGTYSLGLYTTPWQSYNAICVENGGSC